MRDPQTGHVEGAESDGLWPPPLNWSVAIGALVLFWLGVSCGALWILWSSRQLDTAVNVTAQKPWLTTTNIALGMLSVLGLAAAVEGFLLSRVERRESEEADRWHRSQAAGVELPRVHSLTGPASKGFRSDGRAS